MIQRGRHFFSAVIEEPLALGRPAVWAYTDGNKIVAYDENLKRVIKAPYTPPFGGFPLFAEAKDHKLYGVVLDSTALYRQVVKWTPKTVSVSAENVTTFPDGAFPDSRVVPIIEGATFVGPDGVVYFIEMHTPTTEGMEPSGIGYKKLISTALLGAGIVETAYVGFTDLQGTIANFTYKAVDDAATRYRHFRPAILPNGRWVVADPIPSRLTDGVRFEWTDPADYADHPMVNNGAGEFLGMTTRIWGNAWWERMGAADPWSVIAGSGLTTVRAEAISPDAVIDTNLVGAETVKWTADSGATWQSSVIGTTVDVGWDGTTDTVWAVADSSIPNYRKLRKSSDRGQTFAVVGAEFHSVRAGVSLAVLPTGRIVVALLSEAPPDDQLAVAYSDDQGTSWTTVIVDPTLTTQARSYSLLAVSGNIVMMIARNLDGVAREQLWRSTNGGASWIKVGPVIPWPHGFFFLCMDISTGYLFASLVGGVGELYRSTDQGATWTSVLTSTGLTSDFPMRSPIARNKIGELLWIGIGGWAKKSTDNGATWGAYTTPPSPVNQAGLYRVRDTLICSRGPLLTDVGYRSIDDGVTWTSAGMPVAHYAGFAAPSPTPSAGVAIAYGDSATTIKESGNPPSNHKAVRQTRVGTQYLPTLLVDQFIYQTPPYPFTDILNTDLPIQEVAAMQADATYLYLLLVGRQNAGGGPFEAGGIYRAPIPAQGQVPIWTQIISEPSHTGTWLGGFAVSKKWIWLTEIAGAEYRLRAYSKSDVSNTKIAFTSIVQPRSLTTAWDSRWK